MEAARRADVILPRGGLPVPRQVMVANPNLRGIANHGVGYDNVDVTSATELGIPVSNTPGVLTETTADLAWALLMATARIIPQGPRSTLSGEWGGSGGEWFFGQDIGPGDPIAPRFWALSALAESAGLCRQEAAGSK